MYGVTFSLEMMDADVTQIVWFFWLLSPNDCQFFWHDIKDMNIVHTIYLSEACAFHFYFRNRKMDDAPIFYVQF